LSRIKKVSLLKNEQKTFVKAFYISSCVFLWLDKKYEKISKYLIFSLNISSILSIIYIEKIDKEILNETYN